MVKSIFGTYKIKFHADQTESGKGEPLEVDFTPPFRRMSMLEELEKELKFTFPKDMDLNTDGKDVLMLFLFICLFSLFILFMLILQTTTIFYYTSYYRTHTVHLYYTYNCKF